MGKDKVTNWWKIPDILIKNYPNKSAREIAKKLNRTLQSVKNRCKKLKLKKGRVYRWNKEKIIQIFNELKDELNKTPTYQDCRKNILEC